MLSAFFSTRSVSRPVLDIDAQARAVEKAELQKLLRDKGPGIFWARSRLHDTDLHLEVWDEYMEQSQRRPFISHAVEFVFGLKI